VNEPAWTPLVPLAELAPGGMRVAKAGGRQVLVHRDGEGRLFAVDNRCPHEGYPLSQGYVKDCVLTCVWHNFKFDLRDGACVAGDEAVPWFPTRVEAGMVEADLSPRPADGEVERRFASLDTALSERRVGQVARDTVRLLVAGVPPERIAVHAAAFDGLRAEYGATHVLAVASDVLECLSRFPGPEAALPLMVPLDLASEASVRRPARTLVAPEDPGGSPAAAGEALRRRVEAEDAPAAEALLLGALERGWPLAVVEGWCDRLVADHFLDFGHPAIYQRKAFALLRRAGCEGTAAVLSGHLFGIVNATREDLLPPWSAYRRAVAADEPRFEGWRGRAGSDPGWEPLPLREALRAGDEAIAFRSLGEALAAGAPLEAVLATLTLAAAERVLWFDVAHDADPTLQDDWLSATHVLTFARAVREILETNADPHLLRLLYQSARFTSVSAALDRPAAEREIAHLAVPADPERAAAAVVDAVRAKDADAAVGFASGYIAAGLPIAPLVDALVDLPLRGALTRPVVVAHGLKTPLAAAREVASLGDHPERALPLLAAVRFLASPVRERRVEQVVHEALRLVVHGKVPRTLTG